MTLTDGEVSELTALLSLREKSGLGDRGIRRLVDSAGSAAAALRIKGIQLDHAEPSRHPPPVSSWLEEGYGVLPMTSPRYPVSLKELTDPPPILFLKGREELLNGPAIAIVGSRQATGTGRRAADTMGQLLAEGGLTVVSGMALGIDGAAHRGALRGGGRTVAVLGSGFRRIYPAAHRGLFREIEDRGLLVTEFLPFEPALAHHFPKRNRIIAALCKAVIVVEAGRKSGALITVDHGLDLGRDVLVTPGSVENPQARGSNALLREGARALPDPGAVVEELAELGIHTNGAEERPRGTFGDGEAAVPVGMESLWATLSEEPVSVEEIAGQATVSVKAALAGLAALELGGLVRQCPGFRFRRR